MIAFCYLVLLLSHLAILNHRNLLCRDHFLPEWEEVAEANLVYLGSQKSQISADLVVANSAEDYGFDAEGNIEIIKDKLDGEGERGASGELRD